MARQGPETKLVKRMVAEAKRVYGDRLLIQNNHGGMYSATGVSDLTGCLDGWFWACEVKAPESYPVKGEPSVEKALAEGPTVKQRLFIRRVLKAGGVAGFAASVEGFMEILACQDYPCTGHGMEPEEF